MTDVDESAENTALMAHLLRRAGFGATREELAAYVDRGYEATVEALLNPELAPELDEDVVRRYHLDQNSLMLIESSQAYWLGRSRLPRRTATLTSDRRRP